MAQHQKNYSCNSQLDEELIIVAVEDSVLKIDKAINL